MTDLEITKLCAEAMDMRVGEFLPEYRGGPLRLRTYPANATYTVVYNPLHDDAQAMALVKRLHLSIFIWDTLPTAAGDMPAGWWRVDSQGGYITCRHGDLNRAICECVAKMQKAKPTPQDT